VLAEAGSSIERFFASGVMQLKAKLGPINWQFMPTKKFDADDFGDFLKLLPRSIDGRPIRHAVEVRHESFRSPDFVALAREHAVAIVVAADSGYPQIADLTAPFAYLRIMGTSEKEPLGYSRQAIDGWIERARSLAAGTVPGDLASVAPPPGRKEKREVFLYVISGHKALNPAAAIAMIERLG